jgi:hypothetical protein
MILKIFINSQNQICVCESEEYLKICDRTEIIEELLQDNVYSSYDKVYDVIYYKMQNIPLTEAKEIMSPQIYTEYVHRRIKEYLL